MILRFNVLTSFSKPDIAPRTTEPPPQSDGDVTRLKPFREKIFNVAPFNSVTDTDKNARQPRAGVDGEEEGPVQLFFPPLPKNDLEEADAGADLGTSKKY